MRRTSGATGEVWHHCGSDGARGIFVSVTHAGPGKLGKTKMRWLSVLAGCSRLRLLGTSTVVIDYVLKLSVSSKAWNSHTWRVFTAPTLSQGNLANFHGLHAV